MARLLVYIIAFAVIVAVVSALLKLLAIAVVVILGLVLLAMLYQLRKQAVWAIGLVALIALLVKVGPWGWAVAGTYALIEVGSWAARRRSERATAVVNPRPRPEVLPR